MALTHVQVNVPSAPPGWYQVLNGPVTRLSLLYRLAAASVVSHSVEARRCFWG